MQPIRVRLTQIGGSACIPIPITLAKMFEWAPGAIVRAKPKMGGAYFEKEVRALYGGRGSGILVPVEILSAHGLKLGDDVEVPFHEWVTVKSSPWIEVGAEKPAAKTKSKKKVAAKAK